jgi:hypothetical protein
MDDVTGRSSNERLTESDRDGGNGGIDLCRESTYIDLTIMANPSNIADVIDAKIRELEREAAELQAVMLRFNNVNMSLNALRQTRALLVEAEGKSAQNGNMPPSPPSGPPIPPNLTRIVPGSIGATIVEVLQQAGRPMKADEILMAVRQKGKAEVAQPTLASTLSIYVTTGKLKRTAPGIYTLA